MWMKKDIFEKGYLWCTFCLFLIAAAFLMSLKIHQVTFAEMIFVSLYY